MGLCAHDCEQWGDHLHPAAKRPADLNAGEPRTVRIVYFLPRDRQPHQGIDAKLDLLIREVQEHYAEQMENHGFDRKTFSFETDASGKAVVHHVNGRFAADHYGYDLRKSIDEIEEQLGLGIYLCVLDTGLSYAVAVLGRVGFIGLQTIVVPTATHELGHAFGLLHDWRNEIELIPTASIITDVMLTSYCAAEWLDVHPYFNTRQTTSNQSTTIQTPSLSLASAPYDIRLRFEVDDPDGLHQAQLFTGFEWGTYKKGEIYVFGESGLIDCQALDGKSTAVEFVTDLLAKGTGDGVSLRIMDVNGNSTWRSFPIDITALLPPPEPVPVPDPNLAAALRATLLVPSGDAITQLDMLRLWLFHPIAGKDISDFTGLEYATNLRTMDLRTHPTRDINPLISSIAGLTNLRELRLYGNQIRDVSPLAELADSPHLRELRLTGNRIIKIDPLAELTGLHTLWLDHNQISDVGPLSELTNLRELRLAGNPIANTFPLRELLRRNPSLRLDVEVPLLELAKVSGDEQHSPAGTALTDPFVVEVLDQNGAAFAGATVTFAVTAGGGELSVETTTTGSDGRALSTLTLGRTPGTNTVQVTVAGLEPESFTATGVAVAWTLEQTSGDEQEGVAGAALRDAFVLEVRDQNGNPLAGAEVTFAVTAGGGALSTTTAVTDVDGYAAATLTLGTQPGLNTVEATVAGLEPVTFSATGLAVPRTLAKLSGDEQQAAAGGQVAEPLVVSVRDQNGAALPGVVVTFTIPGDGGTLSAAADTTDAEGLAATTLTLGEELGIHTVVVTVADLEPVTFTVTAKASPDFDDDGEVGFSDFFLFAEAFGGSDPRFDLDRSGKVDFTDFFLFAEHFGQPARTKLLAMARELIGLPEGPQLRQNAPNPFNSGTVISWFQLQPGPACVEVFALTGQRVAVLHEGLQKAGFHRSRWDARDDQGRPLASGVYVYRLVTAEVVQTRKLTLLR